MKVPIIKKVAYLILFLLPLLSPAQENMLTSIVPKGITGNVKSILKNIEKQTSIRFNYRNDDLNDNKIFKIEDSISTKAILEIVLSPIGLGYDLLGKETIIIKRVYDQSIKMIISGFVIDKESYNKMPGALVIDLKTKSLTYSDDEGFFVLYLPADTTQLLVSYIGYQSEILFIQKPLTKLYNIYISPGTNLSEAVVKINGDSLIFQQYPHLIAINDEIQKMMPSILGQGDIFNNIGLLPGVQSLRDISPGIVIRGGGPDQNLVLMDGVSIYNPTHLFGLVSIFNPDITQSLKLYKDAFPANYGGRLSSILDVKTRSGNINKYKSKINIGMLASGVVIEGPIKKGRSSFLFSARRSYTDLYIKGFDALSKSNTATPGFFFYDLNLKLQHRFNSHSYINAAFYAGADRGKVGSRIAVNDSTELKENTKTTTSWNTNNAIVRWSYTPKGTLFNNLSLFYTNYELKFADLYSASKIQQSKEVFSEYNYIYKSGIEDWGLKNETDFKIGINNKFKAGLQYIHHRFNPGQNNYYFAASDKNSIDTFSGMDAIASHDFSLFINHIFEYKNKLKTESGLQQAIYTVDGKIYKALQPRFSASLLIFKNAFLLADYSKMAQFIHLLPNNNLGIPYDIWLPVTGNLKPFLSNQISLGFQYKIGNWNYHTDLYLKEQSNILEFKEGANIVFAANNWENEITSGYGNIKGWENLIKYNDKRITFWISYALSKSDRKFNQINNGDVFPYKYDRRHHIALAFLGVINKKWTFSANWMYLSGNPVTIPENKFLIDLEGNPYPIEILGKRNNYRMPAYHRLDISFNKVNEKKWGTVNWNMGVYNVYNHFNPYYLFFGLNEQGKQVLKQRSLLPIVPSISFAISFK